MVIWNFLGKCINVIVDVLLWFIGGFVDFVFFNKMMINDDSVGYFLRLNYGGWNLYFGVCEYLMVVIFNGMFLSGLWVYCGIFFVFMDYMCFLMWFSSIMY